MNEEGAQKLYFEFMELQQQAETLQQHIQAIQEQLKNINQTKDIVRELQTITEPVEGWMQIAPGAFIKATAKPIDTILLNIGANTAVEKAPEEVITTLDEHVGTLEELREAAFSELKEILTKIEAIKSTVEKEPLEK